MKTKGLIPRSWRFIKRLLLFLFIWQFFYIIVLKWIDPPFTITQIGNWFGGYGLKRDYVDYNEISRHAKLAVIASEDQKFLEHSGFDMKAIEKALVYNSKGKKIRGASTISQQTAKNVFLWSGRSWLRKGLETGFTLLIEVAWGKPRILEVYLNSIEFGTGIYGVEAAAQQYFATSSAKLTRQQAALLVTVLPNPHRFLLQRPSPYMYKRQQWVLKQMRQLGAVAKELPEY